MKAKRNRASLPIEVRFERKFKRVDECWIWQGRFNKAGYGVFDATLPPIDRDRPYLAHRVSYELFEGPIPDGLTLDHFVCFNTACVNPHHLEPVTQAENTRRAQERNRTTHCPQGHEFTPENTYQHRPELSGKSGRICRTCHREAERRRFYRRTKGT